MYMGSSDAMPKFPCGPREHIKDCLDELFDAAEDQIDLARDIVDILRELRVEVISLIGQ
jgi:hypothetical protein